VARHGSGTGAGHVSGSRRCGDDRAGQGGAARLDRERGRGEINPNPLSAAN
jgi:hypothetical protein